MESLKKLLFTVTVLFIMIYGCKKDNPVTTGLTVRVIDEQGIAIAGASVTLYKSISDLENDTNQVGTTLTSDANGEVTFNSLDAIEYYWFAEKSCKNNANGNVTTDPLVANQVKVVTATLSDTGSLELTNQSTNQFQVYINGSYLFTADGQYIYSYVYVPAGSYSINVVQVGGSTNNTYTGTITCGSKLAITFP